jgi:hypothetical protein
MTTIRKMLESAIFNLYTVNNEISKKIGEQQLHNVVVLLQKGYLLDEPYHIIAGMYERIEDVPHKEIDGTLN